MACYMSCWCMWSIQNLIGDRCFRLWPSIASICTNSEGLVEDQRLVFLLSVSKAVGPGCREHLWQSILRMSKAFNMLTIGLISQ